jgi:ABC-type uncharacterized transport system auxiliary subunit
MVRYQKITGVLLGLTLSLTGCLNLKQPRNQIEYYTLEYETAPAGNHLPLLNEVIRVKQFSVSPVYNSNRIIYRDKSFIRQAYTYYKWRANPADLVTYYLMRDMQTSGRFKAVVSRNSSVPASCLLEGTVDDFLESDGMKTWEAVLEVSLVLMDENEPDISRKILFQKSYRARKPCRQKTPQALAAAMSLAMSEVTSQIINNIYNVLAARAEKQG